MQYRYYSSAFFTQAPPADDGEKIINSAVITVFILGSLHTQKNICISVTTAYSECDIPIDYKQPIPHLSTCKCERYYLPTEVAIHNKSTDCWVSYNGNVYDLTELCKLWLDRREIEPVLAHAGKDISHWFDHHRNDIKHYVHPVTGVLVPYCPHGPIPDVSSFVVPSTGWRPLNKCPWWLDEKYNLGKLTKNPRPCRIINVLTGTSCIIMVCEEDTIQRIQERALIFNANGASYTWRFEGKCLNINRTLTQNNIPDERERFVACGLREDYYIPSLLCYYIDEEVESSTCKREIINLK